MGGWYVEFPNGVYEEAGTFNGKPCYRKANSPAGYWLWWAVGMTRWVITKGPPGSGAFVAMGKPGEQNLPAMPWEPENVVLQQAD